MKQFARTLVRRVHVPTDESDGDGPMFGYLMNDNVEHPMQLLARTSARNNEQNALRVTCLSLFGPQGVPHASVLAQAEKLTSKTADASHAWLAAPQ